MKTQSTFANKCVSILFICLMAAMPVVTMTGCSFSQAEVVNAVQKVEVGLKTAKAIIPQAHVILQELQSVDPEASEYFANVLSKADPALDKLIAASDAYVQNPGNDSFQALLNGVDAFTAQVDQAALQTVGIKNQQSQAKVVAWIALFSTGLHVTLGILDAYASSKQKKAVPTASAHVSFDQIRPFLDRKYAHDQLAAMGYTNPDEILSYAGL